MREHLKCEPLNAAMQIFNAAWTLTYNSARVKAISSLRMNIFFPSHQ